jgi:integrase
MLQKLSAQSVKKLEVRDVAYEVRDTTLKGLLLRIQPTGLKTYYLEYRNAAAKRNRIKIGEAGSMTADQARANARLLYADALKGVDLQAAKKDKRRQAEAARKRTLGVFLDDVYTPWSEQHHARSTQSRARLRAAFATLMDQPMADLTPGVLEQWRTERRRGGSTPATVNRDITALRGLLSRAVDWGYLEAHPLPRGKLKKLKVDSTSRLRFLAPEEEAALRAALDRREMKARAGRAKANDWRAVRGYPLLPDLWAAAFVDYLKPMVLLAINTGLRRGELFKLDWQDINLRSANLTVQATNAKSGELRHVPLNIEAVDVLKRWRGASIAAGPVFPANAEGERLGNIQTSWENLRKDAGLVDFNFHDLRHTFASKLVMAGVDLNTVRELLGHADIEMTLRYAHLANEHKAEAVNRLVNMVR